MASRVNEDPKARQASLVILVKPVLQACRVSARWQLAWQLRLTHLHDYKKPARSRDRPLKTVEHLRNEKKERKKRARPFMRRDDQNQRRGNGLQI